MNKKTIMALLLAVLFAPSLWAAARRSVRPPVVRGRIHDGNRAPVGLPREKNVVLAVYYQDFTPV